MKAQCFTQILEYELVRMAVAERVRRIKQIKYEKERHKRFDKGGREKFAYLKAYKDNDNSINYQHLDVNQEEDEICMAEL